MEVLDDRVAGLDIGKKTPTVCVRTPGWRGRRAETRTFSTMTRSVQVMRDWLVECGVTIAAMELTSTYWKGAFYCLEEGMEVWLVNAAHIKAISRRKTDVKDAEWIAQLEVGSCVAGAAAGHSPVADADPLPGAADGRPHPGDRPAGADTRGRLGEALRGGPQP